MNFELLRLTKLASAKVTQGSGSVGVGTAPVCPVHVQIIQTKEKLKREARISKAALKISLKIPPSQLSS